MNKILMIFLIISLFFIDGCTVIGLEIGSMIHKEDPIDFHEMEYAEENSWLTISLINNEVIRGQFISCSNDTLYVTYKSPKNFTPISNNQFLSISSNKIVYKLPIDQISDIQIHKGDNRILGAIVGFIIDLSIFWYLSTMTINFNISLN